MKELNEIFSGNFILYKEHEYAILSSDIVNPNRTQPM